MAARRALIVFAKAPVAGTVKTRLAAAIGPERASALHRELVERTLATSRAVRADAFELACAPDASHVFFGECAARFGCTLAAQGEGDLGARMARALARHLQTAPFAVLIGADCPVLDVAYLEGAFERLAAGAAVVLGPAEDGGYVLVGARRVVPAMFEAMSWGVPEVLAVTRERLRTAQVAWQELEPRWDVDRAADHTRYLALCAAESAAAGRSTMRA
jgi:uncharacterized protein